MQTRRKVLFFYNPMSGNGLFKNNIDKVINKFQKKNYQIIPIRANRGKTIEEVLENINQEEYRQIIAAGGDGTINICVNAMIKNNIELPLAIFPSGTANDFARYFELPLDVDKMIDIALGDTLSYADVGKANDKYFINVSALGMLVDVSQKTDVHLKNTLGVFAYYLRGAMDLAILKPLPVKLTTPEKTYEEEMFFMVVMNGESAGGFKNMAPESYISDGKLDVVLFRKMTKIELAPVFMSLLQGQHLENKNILAFSTKKLLVESPVAISTDIDGEKGESLPIEFSVLHKRLRIYTKEVIE